MLGDYAGFVANGFSDLKIAEGESPLPLDRVFYRVNYFNNLSKYRWEDPTEPIHNVALFRQVFGFEKTFLDSRVSIGVRIPFNTLDAQAKDTVLLPAPGGGSVVAPGGPGFASTQFGNVTAILKVPVWEDRGTGSVFSAGAALTFPTASSTLLSPGVSTASHFQPYGAFILRRGDAFVQGFTSIVLPIVRVESILLFVDLGAGYYVYRSDAGRRFLTAVAPTFEVHVTDPLRQPVSQVYNLGLFDTLKIDNVAALTLGTTFEFYHRATLGVGFVSPVTGPKPYDWEVLAQLNYRF